MSPPVLGTLMALCVIYILPSSDDGSAPPLLKVPVPTLAGGKVDMSTSAEGSGAPTSPEADCDSESATMVSACAAGRPMLVRLPFDKSGGLYGVSIVGPEPYRCYFTHCDFCKERFGDEDVRYLWRCRHVSVESVFHEHCVLLHSEKDKADHHTITKVKELLQACEPDHYELLASLHAIESDLTRMAAWAIDDPSDDGSAMEGLGSAKRLRHR